MNGRRDKHASSSALRKSETWLLVLTMISAGVTMYEYGVITGREELERELGKSDPLPEADVFHPGD